MIDIALIRSEPDRLRAALAKRMDAVDFTRILALDEERRKLVERTETRRARRNELSKSIGQLKRQGADTSAGEAEVVALKGEIAELETALRETESRLQAELAELPNYPDERVPAGGKEHNQVVKTWGDAPSLPEPLVDHVELSAKLGLVDHKRGVKLGGGGFWIYTGMGAALEWALLDFFVREHRRDGYEFLLPPHMLLDACGYAAGQFPKFRDDVFHIENPEGDRNLFLLPTAETAVLNFYRDETLSAEALPFKAFAYTPCYRREAGGYRSDERGTVRGHQFNKVELFQFTTPEQAEDGLEELVRKAETLLEKLGLHYQTSLLAARDASASMALTYDVEVWLPSIGAYKEVSSASWARDYQARRANIRFKPAGSKKSAFMHTLNASGLATSRLVPAILEQCQQKDGTVVVPEPLRDSMGVEVLRPPA